MVVVLVIYVVLQWYLLFVCARQYWHRDAGDDGRTRAWNRLQSRPMWGKYDNGSIWGFVIVNLCQILAQPGTWGLVLHNWVYYLCSGGHYTVPWSPVYMFKYVEASMNTVGGNDVEAYTHTHDVEALYDILPPPSTTRTRTWSWSHISIWSLLFFRL